MQIHELLPRKKVNEGLGDFFGLNNPKVKEVWNSLGSDLVQNIAAKFTSDPRYAKLPFEQAKAAMMRDEFVQDTANKSLESWNQYVAQLQLRNGGELNDQQYNQALLAWANRGLFNGRYNELGANAKQVAQAHFADITKNRRDPKKVQNTFASLVADETARVVQVATDLKAQMAAQANMQAAKIPGQPAQPAPPAPTVSFGGDPQDQAIAAKLLAMAKTQGKA